MKKFKVEIWSDITCVHCYIAKRNFENALAQFEHAANVEIVGKSFELAPNLKVQQGQSMYNFLAKYNGATVEQVKTVCASIVSTGQQVGIVYNFDIAIPANSFLAHRFAHLAGHYGKQAEELLFRAHFTDGKNIDSIETLTHIANTIGIDEDTVVAALQSDAYTDQVLQDIAEAKELGIKGVPYYWFNRTQFVLWHQR